MNFPNNLLRCSARPGWCPFRTRVGCPLLQRNWNDGTHMRVLGRFMLWRKVPSRAQSLFLGVTRGTMVPCAMAGADVASAVVFGTARLGDSVLQNSTVQGRGGSRGPMGVVMSLSPSRQSQPQGSVSQTSPMLAGTRRQSTGTNTPSYDIVESWFGNIPATSQQQQPTEVTAFQIVPLWRSQLI
jgi:hypothetical protein